ncbi:tRNA threonylcarbamoyl adenosine modification protein (Sua5/YciO/YrdC/YwlC family) [Ornithinimicrobium humiphilum]|uniref:tRNA threonylcarbamoyl adenosine modification protein (Sua5/YciO/YrdC/YwlC family) n=1 Tax=Ornithinimicrobium humiphilum TaxID=125288 RepID=A0A543KP00_9MICO|nr:L-threonylcarbamoyladenylate synthase [Ornithinimicrobium humiphilum]TQM96784.1 tRNA threonylcarbamoyl adenosine modification protein (Sua5/YciO/YrdC/YwlC family) [Ornithinimicrobium humiphilum]
MARFVDIHPVDPQPRLVAQVVDILQDGGLAAFPTDACFTLGARLSDAHAKQRIIDIRHLDGKHHFTLMCSDFAQLGSLVQLDNSVFRAIRAATPGPYTFILPATGEVPRRLLHPKKRTVGVRIPDHKVCRALLDAMGEPLLTSTLLLPDHEEPIAMGWDVKEALDHVVDVVVDGDQTGQEPTTVVDFSEGYPEVVRVGAGDPTPFE